MVLQVVCFPRAFTFVILRCQSFKSPIFKVAETTRSSLRPILVALQGRNQRKLCLWQMANVRTSLLVLSPVPGAQLLSTRQPSCRIQPKLQEWWRARHGPVSPFPGMPRIMMAVATSRASSLTATTVLVETSSALTCYPHPTLSLRRTLKQSAVSISSQAWSLDAVTTSSSRPATSEDARAESSLGLSRQPASPTSPPVSSQVLLRTTLPTSIFPGHRRTMGVCRSRLQRSSETTGRRAYSSKLRW
mmetsp:Transcript_69111/g.111405  ORF Transcript_69111/g.111405 Transcript_69111/m.111405 type:complete len:246 (-) Transcript_69111:238-975(-)